MIHRQATKSATVLMALACLLVVTGGAVAQSGGSYDLSWNTVEGGGYTFSLGGPYVLGGTIGQLDAGLLIGEDYVLGGGFWKGGAAAQYRIYLPVLLRNV